MKVGGLAILRCAVILLGVAVIAPLRSHAQASVYGELTVVELSSHGSDPDALVGPTIGLLVDGSTFSKRVMLQTDVQFQYLNKAGGSSGGNSGPYFYEAAAGPRAVFKLQHHVNLFTEFLVGFGRFRNPSATTASTDSQIQVNGGVTARMTPRLDFVAQYSYQHFYAVDPQYTPKSGSVGVIFHFKKTS